MVYNDIVFGVLSELSTVSHGVGSALENMPNNDYDELETKLEKIALDAIAKSEIVEALRRGASCARSLDCSGAKLDQEFIERVLKELEVEL